MAEVVLDNVSKEFRPRRGQFIPALKNVSFRAEDGELLVIVGPSASGKTTLLRMIAGLEEIDRGAISIGGKVVNGIDPKDRDVAMVFQNYALYPHMTVYHNIAFPLKLRRCSKEEMSRAVNEAAEMLGVSDLLQRKPETLSGGQRQRIAVARAIVRKPALFLFDEPLSQIDPPMRAQMRAEISKLHVRLGATMIYVTHDQAEAMTLGERIVVMNRGEVQQIGAPIEIYNQPASMFVAGFIGSPPMNFFHGSVVEQAADIIFCSGRDPNQPDFEARVSGAQLKSMQAYRNSSVVLGLRPEHIRIDPTASSVNSPGTVQLVEPMGAETFIHLQVGTSGCVARVSGIPQLRIGEQVPVQWAMANALFFDPTSGQRIYPFPLNSAS